MGRPIRPSEEYGDQKSRAVDGRCLWAGARPAWQSPVRILFRFLLLIAIARLTGEAVLRYGFAFDEGYPVAPLIGIILCFIAWVQLRPPHSAPKPVVYTGQSMGAILFVVLAAVSAAFILTFRKEAAFSSSWSAHLGILTLFLLLIPYIVSYPFVRTQTTVGVLVALTLTATLWKGSELARSPKEAVGDLDSPREQRVFPQTIPASGGSVPQARPVRERLPHPRRAQPRST